jgi:hypothetical protein
MAIAPKDVYPSQTEVTDGYPFGKAKNRATLGDPTGTPLEKQWVNDIWGFFQALLTAAGITPSGSPDQLEESQYLNAIEQRINAGTNEVSAAVVAQGTELDGLTDRVETLEAVAGRLAVFSVASQTVLHGSRLALVESLDPQHHYSVSSGRIAVDDEGYYEISATISVTSLTDFPNSAGFRLMLEDTQLAKAQRNQVDASQLPMSFCASAIARITDKTLQRLNVVALTSSGQSVIYEANGIVTVKKIRRP